MLPGLLAGSLTIGAGCSGSSDDSPDIPVNGKADQTQMDRTEAVDSASDKPLSDKCGDGVCDQFEKDMGICGAKD